MPSTLQQVDLGGVSEIDSLLDLRSNHMTQVGTDVLIDTGGMNSILLLDVEVTDLFHYNFIF